MVVLFAQTDRIMIKLMIGEAETGFYSAAITCASLTAFVFNAIIDSVRPIILENKSVNNSKYICNIKKLFSVIIYGGISQSLIITMFAGVIVSILYGNGYAAVKNILMIVTWYTTFSYVGSVRNIWILAENKEKYLWIINLSGALLNIIGNFLIIPYYGACGAALISVITQIFSNFILCFIVKPIKPIGIIILKSLNPKILLTMLSKRM